MVFKKDLIKLKKKKNTTLPHTHFHRTINMYKILAQIHSNYKFKKNTFKNIQIHGLSDCLAKGVKTLDGMKFV